MAGSPCKRICWVRLKGPTTNLFIIAIYVSHKARVKPAQSDTLHTLTELLKTVLKNDCVILLGGEYVCCECEFFVIIILFFISFFCVRCECECSVFACCESVSCMCVCCVCAFAVHVNVVHARVVCFNHLFCCYFFLFVVVVVVLLFFYFVRDASASVLPSHAARA